MRVPAAVEKEAGRFKQRVETTTSTPRHRRTAYAVGQEQKDKWKASKNAASSSHSFMERGEMVQRNVHGTLRE